jgi:glycosyltransferase involved in cell wall biosynthesis
MVHVRATVAICTHNRAAVVASVVRSVVHQADEVVVVDNASSDDTAVVVGELITNHPNVRYVEEPNVGLSHARNRAMAEAAHDVVVFVDDDAVAGDGLVAAHLAAYEDFRVGAAGGRIDLAWPKGRRPWWLPHALDGMYAGLELGSDARDLGPSEGPYGANMSVRRDLGRKLGFDPALGRQGTSLISNEETHFFARLRRTHVVRYVPDAVVSHAVLPGRDELGYLLRRSFASGQSDVIASQLDGNSMRAYSVLASLAGNAARTVTLRGAGTWGPKGCVAGLAWSAEDLGRLRALTSGRRGASEPQGSS